MRDTNRTWAEIDLDAIEHNVRAIKKQLNPGVKLMGVVKADGYGHGVIEIAETILASGADYLSVAFVDEAIQLRKSGISAPIVILGKTLPEFAGELLWYDIIPCVADVEFAEALSKEAVRQGKTAKIHIKIDTGMTRIGFFCDDDLKHMEKAKDEIIKISKLPGIEIEGAFTHFAMADDNDGTYTKMQFKRFCDFVKSLEKSGIKIKIKHVSNSAAVVNFPEMQLDMVRAGILIYGLKPFNEPSSEAIDVIPAMTFKTRVMHVKEVGRNTRVSYGGAYETSENKKIATIAVGYADGYSRLLSGKAEVVFDGKRLKQIGRICMDQCMIDATEVNNINVGDEIILFGGGRNAVVSADDVAEKLGTINYEVACMIGQRVPRVYIKSGKAVRSRNFLLCNNDL